MKTSFVVVLVLYIIVAVPVSLLIYYLDDQNLYTPTKFEWGGAEVESIAKGVRVTLKYDNRLIRITANEMRQTGDRVTAFDVTILDGDREMTAGKATFRLTPLGVEDLLLEDKPQIRSIR